MNRDKQPTIVISAFGTSVPSGRRQLEAFDSMVRERFPNHDVRWALTSPTVLGKLRTAGENTMFANRTPVKTLEEVYADLRSEGKKNAVVLCAYVMPGWEYYHVTSYPAEGLLIRYAKPLLIDSESIGRSVDALAKSFENSNTVTILCAHGNGKYPEYNIPLVETDRYLRANYKNTYLATVVGQPGTNCFIDVLQSKAESVHFVPFMLVAGEHLLSDILGDHPQSWKSQLRLPTTAGDGLGSNRHVMELFLQNIEDALGDFESEV